MNIHEHCRQAQARRMSEYRRQAKRKGVRRIELQLPDDTIQMLDALARKNRMTRAQCVTMLIRAHNGYR